MPNPAFLPAPLGNTPSTYKQPPSLKAPPIPPATTVAPPSPRYPGEAPSRDRPSQHGFNAGYNVSGPFAQQPPASDFDYAYLAGRDMVVPGVYTFALSAKRGTPRVELQARGYPLGKGGGAAAWGQRQWRSFCTPWHNQWLGARQLPARGLLTRARARSSHPSSAPPPSCLPRAR